MSHSDEENKLYGDYTGLENGDHPSTGSNHDNHKSTHHGITQTIRSKLNFNDESRWKKFSARRLELIDGLQLSSKKASEQDEQISHVANTLRQEYSFPPETLPDFDKLVRAGIQSVRRNRKRQPKTKTNLKRSASPPAESFGYANRQMRSMSSSESNDGASTASRMPSWSSPYSNPPPLQSYPASGTWDRLMSPMSGISNSKTKDCQVLLAIRRLHSYLTKNEIPLPPVNGNGPRNMHFLGESALRTAVSYAIEKRFAAPSHIDHVDEIRDALLNPSVIKAVSLTVTYNTITELHLVIAGCCRSFGFDPTISVISNLFYEILCIETKIDFCNPMDILSILPNALVNINSSHHEPLPILRPVTLTFQDKKFELTYSPSSNTPPTMAELLENGKNAFHIMSAQRVQIRCVNTGVILNTDVEVMELFNDSARIDLEFTIPWHGAGDDTKASNASMSMPSSAAGNPGGPHLHHNSHQNQSLPPLSSIASRPRYQELL